MRRQMIVLGAALAVLAAAWPVVAGLISGTVRSVDQKTGKLVVETGGGKAQTIKVTEGAEVTLDDKRAKLADLSAGHKVSVFTSASGEATRVRARNEAAAAT